MVKQSFFVNIIFGFFAFIFGVCAGFPIFAYVAMPKNSDEYIVGDLKIHFFEFGNKNTGDCIFIQIGKVDIIVDGGPNVENITTIQSYIQPKLTDGKIEYAIITHADEDHIACFAGSDTCSSLFDIFTIETVIDFPMTNKTEKKLYKRYIEKRDSSGAKVFDAYKMYKNQPITDLGNNVQLEILFHKYYLEPTSKENDYSVCFQLVQEGRKFLFTGDLEKSGEESLVKKNNPSQVEFFKAGHHGSNTSSTDTLLKVIKPKLCVIPCDAGYTDYNFPSQEFLNRIKKYTTKVYAPSKYNPETKEKESLNGNIVITSNKCGVSVECSNNNDSIFDSTWYQQNRAS